MNQSPLQVLLCQCLYPEAKAALEERPVPGLEVACLPRTCTPRRAELQALLEEAGNRCAQAGGALLVGGGCLAAHPECEKYSGLQVACRSTCFTFFAPAEQVDELLRQGAYLVTPGWLSGWPKVLADWGLQASEAREFFGESCRSIALLDTGMDDKAFDNLKAFAEFVGLPFERVSVGLHRFREALLEEAWSAREVRLASLTEDMKKARRRLAEASVLVDLVHRLSALTEEDAIVSEILQVAQSLFAPASMLWIPHWKAQWGEAEWTGPHLASLEAELRACSSKLSPSSDGDGMLFRLEGTDGPMGLLGLARLAFPDQIPAYLETAKALIEAAQLALGNARNLHGMIRICAWCRKVKDESQGWGTFEEYIHEQSSATFSHGMCPDCSAKVVREAEAQRSKRAE